MSYGEFDPSPMHGILRNLMRTFRIGWFFGVEVRMYWAAAIGMPLLSWFWIAPSAVTWAEELTLALTSTVLLFVIIWSHEMGHIVCGWRYRIRTDLITLSPLGGVAHMNAPATTPRAELGIALAGPAVHLVWLAVFWPLKVWVPYGAGAIAGWGWDPLAYVLTFLVFTNVGLLLFNLLPIFPMDGGRCLRALLSMRWHPNRATMWATMVGFIGGGLMIFSGFFRTTWESAIPIWIGVSCIIACINERRVARHALIYDESLRRELWESDPEAWKHASAAIARDRVRRPGFFTRWRLQRAARSAAAAREADAALNREVDEILERVHKVGMTGLSNREKAVLKQAANRRRGAG